MKKYWIIALLVFLWLVAVTLLVLCFTIFKENNVLLVVSIIVVVIICITQRIVFTHINKK